MNEEFKITETENPDIVIISPKDVNWGKVVLPNQVFLQINNESWLVELLPNEPLKMKEGYQYTIKLITKL